MLELWLLYQNKILSAKTENSTQNKNQPNI